MWLPFAVHCAIWYYRHRHGDPTAVPDLFIALIIDFWSRPSIVTTTGIGGELLIANLTRTASWVCFILLVVLMDTLSESRIQAKTRSSSGKQTTLPWTKPLLLPGRTTHSRFTPSKHSFSYSYFLVGVPVGWSGSAGISLSVDSDCFAVLSVKAEDHLIRGSDDSNLQSKLQSYLETQNVDPSLYPYAFLVTAPRVLGYNFNPVSFWYLYSSKRELEAMVLEVNNTFDERHMYLLVRTSHSDTRGSLILKSSFKKEFHVSPFNDRGGVYDVSVKALDFDGLDAPIWMSNTVTLSSPEHGTKLVARVFSTQPPLVATNLTIGSGLRLFLRVGWVGFLTFPRILREAWTLYFKKHLAVWYRPEVGRDSVGRTQTEGEEVIEVFFRRYLDYVIRNYNGSIQFAYRPARGLGLQDKFVLGSGSGAERQVTMTVLTPAFYSRLVHYASLMDAIVAEGCCEDLRNRTIELNDPESFIRVLLAIEHAPLLDNSAKFNGRHSILDNIRWHILGTLRCAPSQHSYPAAHSNATIASHGDKRMSRVLSPLDIFVSRYFMDSWRYRRQVSAFFIAQRGFGGFLPLLNATDLACRFALAMAGLKHNFSSGQELGTQGLIWQSISINLTNLWSIAKGL